MIRFKWCRLSVWRNAMVFASAVLCLSACASSSETALHGEASALINRDYTGKPLSVVMHLYQLKSEQQFAKLTYEALTSGKAEQALLGGDLIGMKDYVILPGGVLDASDLKIDEQTRFIALVAFFRQPDRANWRLLFPVEQVKGKKLQFKVEDCYLVALQPQGKALPDQVKGRVPVCNR